jgi:hypothetical protein
LILGDLPNTQHHFPFPTVIAGRMAGGPLRFGNLARYTLPLGNETDEVTIEVIETLAQRRQSGLVGH